MKCLSGRSRGTCIEECPMYGRCHCECGRATTISSTRNSRVGYFVGHPYIHANGHRANPHSPGYWQTSGIPIERVRPLVTWLVQECGASGRRWLRSASTVVTRRSVV